MAELGYLSIKQTHELLVSKEVSAVVLTQYYLDRIKQYDDKVKACLYVCEKEAIAQAKAVDEKIASGQVIGAIEGIPYTAKDMFLTTGIVTTAASKILKDYMPPYSATVVEKLNKAGAILLAKVNQDEYGHGGSTENSGYHPTHNPWDLERVPGGSSGGSAAAVAMDFGIFSLGTDTGGSTRQPAAYCGVVGYKPTYGLISRYGVVAMASSLDTIGTLARNADDVARLVETIAGRDQQDSTTIESNFKLEDLSSDVKIGVLDSYKDLEQVKNFVGAIKPTEEFTQAEFINPELALATYYVLTPSEISSNLERYDGIRYGQSSAKADDLYEVYAKTRDEFFGPEVKRRNMIGTYALSAGYYDAYYKKAMQARTLICQTFDRLFEQFDLIVTPTTLTAAFKLGDKSDPVEMYKEDILTVSANLAGIPAVSIPAGVDSETGLPLGLQVMGRQGEDAKVISAARAFQAKTDWHKRVEGIRL
ncbi:Asp-tRNA(Asn)/Glu-tRNA(Gln) amidotransferase subunit GatA [Candidatus Saccharibacteria bacterium]|nr:Asp-tRNA(Asn)/Glu-tRNA(Gln) amidotransferase subunit GatA [Candidatus Saccharibacteria bacterium]